MKNQNHRSPISYLPWQDREEEQQLFEEYAQAPLEKRRQLEERIIRANVAFVRREAQRFARIFEADSEDLEQVGYIHLLTCAKLFDVKRGVRFLSYAAQSVSGSIQRSCLSLNSRTPYVVGGGASREQKNEHLKKHHLSLQETWGDDENEQTVSESIGDARAVNANDFHLLLHLYRQTRELFVGMSTLYGGEKNREIAKCLLLEPGHGQKQKIAVRFCLTHQRIEKIEELLKRKIQIRLKIRARALEKIGVAYRSLLQDIEEAGVNPEQASYYPESIWPALDSLSDLPQEILVFSQRIHDLTLACLTSKET